MLKHTEINDGRCDSDLSPESPAVSVIMPAYNVAQFIGESLDSVFKQTFDDYEVIVINDGSPDTQELERVLEPYRRRINYIVQENRGLSGARNTGIRAARGRFIALLDSDDLWEPDYLAVQMAEFESDPEIDVLYPNALIFGNAPEAGKKFMDLSPSTGSVTFESLVTQRCNVMVSVTARREMIERVGMFDEKLRSVEDFDLWLRVLKAGGRIKYHRRVLVRYRRWQGSLSSDPVWMCKHVLQVLEKASRTFDLSSTERQTLDRARSGFSAKLMLQEGKRAFFHGDTKAAINNLTEANAFFKSRKIKLTLWLLRLTPQLLLRAYNVRDRFFLRTSTKF